MRVNLPKLLELMMNDGACMLTGKQYPLAENQHMNEFDCFEKLYDWFKRELKHLLNDVCEYIDYASMMFPQHWSTPFTSCMMDGCLERGKDVTDEGTIYNNLTINFVGVATLVDSLQAIEELVYQEKKTTMGLLCKALRTSFREDSTLQKELKKKAKYGNDNNDVDQKMVEIVELIVKTISQKKTKYRKGKFQTGFYTSYFHASMGEKTAATSDGRLAKEALSSSLSPTSGMDQNGRLAVLNSASKIDMSHFGNGTVLDMRFMPTFFEEPRNREALKNMIDTYFTNGGMEIQFNVVDTKTLLEAQNDPIAYADLVVRVSGFSAHFARLDKNLQDEIIRRTAYC